MRECVQIVLHVFREGLHHFVDEVPIIFQPVNHVVNLVHVFVFVALRCFFNNFDRSSENDAVLLSGIAAIKNC